MDDDLQSELIKLRCYAENRSVSSNENGNVLVRERMSVLAYLYADVLGIKYIFR